MFKVNLSLLGQPLCPKYVWLVFFCWGNHSVQGKFGFVGSRGVRDKYGFVGATVVFKVWVCWGNHGVCGKFGFVRATMVFKVNLVCFCFVGATLVFEVCLGLSGQPWCSRYVWLVFVSSEQRSCSSLVWVCQGNGGVQGNFVVFFLLGQPWCLR